MNPSPQKMKAAREAKGWTQGYAAGLLAVTARTVRGWETSSASYRRPSDLTLRAIAGVYGCAVADLCEVANA